ncbi:VRR-NUC domain-containing protein [Cupriavidus basilensis]|uniref:VRR-NUC domain-containing protein n=1 Tax=Cupriavidus basilensis TaxID=68895 RepID=UPI00157B4E4A|nr:VRR-NUC domain-containing protein [Cupriavidus basilensis]NUA32010.1 VRR-NUC domain-containing protein [Cupriavidus basilensis]
MGSSYKTYGNTCTTLEERKEYGRIPPADKGYVAEKAEFALRFPRVSTIRRKDGSSVQALLQQLVVCGAIRFDESKADFYWHYKAEVCFDMTTFPPKPFLSSGKKMEGPSRRHSLNPFPPGHVPGFLRRPDIIIVSSDQIRWPGLATIDHEGQLHPDNLRRVVELKFPRDELDDAQKNAYLRIAGDDPERLVVADVNDCKGDLEKAREVARHPAPAPLPSERERERAPIRTRQPIAEPAFYELWLKEFEEGTAQVRKQVHSLIDEAQRGIQQLSAEAQAWLSNKAPWLFEAGRWVRDAATDSWTWINENGQAAMRWTKAQMVGAWRELHRQTDLTWQQLQQIDWSQVLIDLVGGIAVVGLALAGVVVAIALTQVLVVALLALLGILASGAVTAGALLAALAATAAAT